MSVAGIVINGTGQVLVIKRADNGQWQPPGGVLELDETAEAGVRREIEEETGVTVAVDALTGVYKNMRQGVVALVYRCRPVAGAAHPTSEATEAAWMTPDAASAVMTEPFAIRVRDAFDSTAYSRAHDGIHVMPADKDGAPGTGKRT